eukprot:1597872-Prorocentrum_lima.AAC.1
MSAPSWQSGLAASACTLYEVSNCAASTLRTLPHPSHCPDQHWVRSCGGGRLPGGKLHGTGLGSYPKDRHVAGLCDRTASNPTRAN